MFVLLLTRGGIHLTSNYGFRPLNRINFFHGSVCVSSMWLTLCHVSHMHVGTCRFMKARAKTCSEQLEELWSKFKVVLRWLPMTELTQFFQVQFAITIYKCSLQVQFASTIFNCNSQVQFTRFEQVVAGGGDVPPHTQYMY